MQVSIRKTYGKKYNEVKPSPFFWPRALTKPTILSDSIQHKSVRGPNLIAI
jgi:hypothetical protein